jgi:hypothetical protein
MNGLKEKTCEKLDEGIERGAAQYWINICMVESTRV